MDRFAESLSHEEDLVTPMQIVIVEPDGTIRSMYEHVLREQDFSVRSFGQITETAPTLQSSTCDLLIARTDPGRAEDHDHLARWMEAHPRIAVVRVLSQPSAGEVVDAIRAGAVDVLIQPHGPAELIACVQSAARRWEGLGNPSHEKQLEVAARMASGIAHHFNNLLERVLGRTSLLLGRSELSADMYQELHDILEDNRDMAAFVRRMSHFGQSAIIQPTAIQPLQVLEETVRRLVDRRKARIRFHAAIEPEVTMAGEKGLLSELLEELLTNAREAGPEDQTIVVRAVLEPDGDDPHLVISIEDQGPGLTRWQMDHLYEPFFSTKSPPGRGLGLAVACGIAHRLGGVLDIRNRPVGGAIATVRFPVTIGPAAVVEPPPAPPVSAQGSVMVIDDEQLVLDMISRMASKITRCPVISVANGEEAVELLSNPGHEVTMVLLDVCLRDISGIAIYRQIRRSNPDLPVLFVSGLASDPDLVEVLAEDPQTRFLPKPFELNKLRREMDALRASAPAPDVALS